MMGVAQYTTSNRTKLRYNSGTMVSLHRFRLASSSLQEVGTYLTRTFARHRAVAVSFMKQSRLYGG
ncbi:hypothetical protein D3C77_685160 [compost metagenome]